MKVFLINYCLFWFLINGVNAEEHKAVENPTLPRVSATVSPIANSRLGILQKHTIYPETKDYTVELTVVDLNKKGEAAQKVFALQKSHNFTYSWKIEDGYLCIRSSKSQKLLVKVLMIAIDESYISPAK